MPYGFFLYIIKMLLMSQTIQAFLGIILQAFPFLITGVLLSSLIGMFVSRRFIERYFPKNIAGGIVFALIGGFCLPVCDCVSIPVFRSLVKKGIPLTSAIVFMCASPVINPVVILSTYYAFGGNMRIVAARVSLGIVCAVLTGLSFLVKRPHNPLKNEAGETFHAASSHAESCTHSACSCCAHNTESDTETHHAGAFDTFVHFLEHSRREFFEVGSYLIIGAALSAAFQTLGGKLPLIAGNTGKALSLFIMMSFAFLLSLCSSSDAVIGRTFMPRFSIGSVMGFLVFGPMMDIKNMLMLSSGFTKGFTFRLVISSFTICYLVMLGAMFSGLEALL